MNRESEEGLKKDIYNSEVEIGMMCLTLTCDRFNTFTAARPKRARVELSRN